MGLSWPSTGVVVTRILLKGTPLRSPGLLEGLEGETRSSWLYSSFAGLGQSGGSATELLPSVHLAHRWGLPAGEGADGHALRLHEWGSDSYSDFMYGTGAELRCGPPVPTSAFVILSAVWRVLCVKRSRMICGLLSYWGDSLVMLASMNEAMYYTYICCQPQS